MDWVVFLLLYLSFLFIYKTNRTVYYIYTLLFSFFFFFALHKVGYGLAYTSLNTLLLSLLTIVLFNGSNLHRYGKLYLYFVLLFNLYLVFISLIQGVPFFTRFNAYKSSIILMMWGLLLMDDIYFSRVNLKKLQCFFYSFLVFEMLLGGLEYIFDPIRDFFRNVNYIKEGEVAEIQDVSVSGIMNGSFRDVGVYTNFLATCFVIVFLNNISKKRVKPEIIILLVLLIAEILFSGVRSPFLVTILVSFASIFIYQRQLLKPIIFVVLVLLVFMGGINVASVDNLRQVGFEDGGLARTMTLFNSFSGDALTTQTTFAMTACMIPYILLNPIIGVGLHQKGGYMLSLWDSTLEDFSVSDAMLAFEVAEIGIIGVLIYLWPLWKYIKMSNKINLSLTKYKLLLSLLILMTIVDTGFKDLNQLLLFFFASAIWGRPTEKYDTIQQ